MELMDGMLKIIRDSALTCQDALLRFQLRKAADNLQASLIRLRDEGTSTALTDVIGGWAHSLRLLDRINNGAPAGNGAGLTEPARLAA